MEPLTIKLSKTVLDSIDLGPLFKFVEWNEQNIQYFNLPSGVEHYRLLAYLSTVIPGDKIIDIGTYFGFSAAALSYNSNKKVISYDIFDWIPEDKLTVKNALNIELKVMNCLNDINELAQTSLILLDIDHNGKNELDILNALRAANYKGLVMLDDIGLNDEMKALWQGIPEKKIDVSIVGHFSLSGIVIFDPTKFDIVLENI